MHRHWKTSCYPRRKTLYGLQDGLRRIDGDSMARVDVLMPQMGESIAEGTWSKWLKKLGDEVKRDEPLFEISTDKVDAEIPAPNAGVLVEIKVQEGQTVPVQTLVAVIETDKGASATAAPSAAAQRAPAASGAAVASSPPALKPAPAPAATSPDLPRPSPSSPVPPKGDGGVETAEERLRRKSTPLVRKIAAEHQVDISTIPGTGFAGRVTKQDIPGGLAGAAPAPRPAAATPVGPIDHPVVEPWPGDRVEPFSKIRKITADHMIMSRRVSAHVTSFFEVDYTQIAELRRRHKQAYSERGANLTYLTFIAKTCAETLRQHPVVNAAVSGDNIIYRRDINIGIAAPNEADYLATLRELCQFAEARSQRIWLFRNAKDPQLFIEFSESPTEMSHRAQASRLPEEIKLERRLQALGTYAPDAWELWTEVPLTAAAEA